MLCSTNIIISAVTLITLHGIFADEDLFNPCEARYTGLHVHPEECQLFFNCSISDDNFPLGKYIDECQYPDVFDSDTKSCRDFHVVDCEERDIIYNGCDYRREKDKCNHAHCRPCVYGVDYPKCEGLPNGDHPIPELLWTPYYARCDTGRGIKRKCPLDGRGRQMIFHVTDKVCVQRQ